MTRATIFGCSGLTLTAEEAAFFREAQPWGFILFARNIAAPDQTRALVQALRATVGRQDAPVLIDQEGGRVARLRPPHWPLYPPGAAYAQVEGGLAARCEVARLGARLIAHDLAMIGINADCAPVLDVPSVGAHDVIGDRAYGGEPADVAALGRAVAEGLLAGGVLPIIKHIPGHGRAMSDSHLDLPVVEASLDQLIAHDFAPFAALADMPIAMTAHVVYAAIDPRRPATTSAEVIETIIRGRIGFEGLLIGDDLSMQALSGDLASRTRDSLAAGCDVVLHCNGDMAEMIAVAGAAGPLAGRASGRAQSALERLPERPESLNASEARRRFDACFQGRFAA